MEILTNKKMSDIDGGGYGFIAFTIGLAVSFVMGVIDGYINPKKCKN